MYRDYFDIKGPIFFFWEAFGQFLHKDRLGIFLLQVICSVVASFFVYKIARFYGLTKNRLIAVFVIYYMVYGVALWGGNTVEEYCLPLNLACIYFGIQFLYKVRESTDIAYFFGITFAICLFSKVTVCAPMGAIVFVVFITLIRQKEWNRLLKCILYFCFGTLTVLLPVVIYFAARGALNEMLLCAFKIAFARSTDFYVGIDWNWEKPILICYFAIILGLFGYIFNPMDKRETIDGAILCSLGGITAISLHLGTPFDYYFISTLPVLVFVSVFIFKNMHSLVREHEPDMSGLFMKRMVFGIVAIMIVLSTYWGRTWDKIKENYDLCVHKSEMWNYDACRDIFSLIPEDERDGVFGIESGMIVYEVNQKLPCNRYPVNMPYFCELYEPAESEIISDLENNCPKWVMTEDISELENDNIKVYVIQHYDRLSDIGNNTLWRRKGM